MKQSRQRAILELVRAKNIFTQEELTAELTAAGFSATQATVSRDIRELGLVKMPANKSADSKRKQERYATFKYVAADGAEISPLARVFREGLVGVDFAGNMLVLKTLGGMAMAVAAALDSMKYDEILGTVAGDDTIICVVRSEAAAADLAGRLC
ncbi:MAG: arginine repressor [Defluviitaleaceae bacterium]|nr:arginine repressor [Defluviitaleaceae bacterium]